MTIYQVQDKCKKVIRSLVEFGELVCGNFECKSESTYICKNCGYSQYIHLCKEIVEAN